MKNKVKTTQYFKRGILFSLILLYSYCYAELELPPSLSNINEFMEVDQKIAKRVFLKDKFENELKKEKNFWNQFRGKTVLFLAEGDDKVWTGDIHFAFAKSLHDVYPEITVIHSDVGITPSSSGKSTLKFQQLNTKENFSHLYKDHKVDAVIGIRFTCHCRKLEKVSQMCGGVDASSVDNLRSFLQNTVDAIDWNSSAEPFLLIQGNFVTKELSVEKNVNGAYQERLDGQKQYLENWKEALKMVIQNQKIEGEILYETKDDGSKNFYGIKISKKP